MITLYYGPKANKESYEDFVPSKFKIGKIEEVGKISKSKKNNNTLYALIGETLDNVIPLGIVQTKTKQNETIYIGKIIYTTSKEMLCEYYKIKAHETERTIQENIESLKKQLKEEKIINGITTYYYDWLEKECTLKIKKLKMIKQTYKEIIKTIKNL